MKPPCASILETIGNTPLVEICRLHSSPGVKIFAKMECFNPGGSIKDRAALAMITGAEKRGELTRDKVILEATSGNVTRTAELLGLERSNLYRKMKALGIGPKE